MNIINANNSNRNTSNNSSNNSSNVVGNSNNINKSNARYNHTSSIISINNNASNNSSMDRSNSINHNANQGASNNNNNNNYKNYNNNNNNVNEFLYSINPEEQNSDVSMPCPPTSLLAIQQRHTNIISPPKLSRNARQTQANTTIQTMEPHRPINPYAYRASNTANPYSSRTTSTANPYASHSNSTANNFASRAWSTTSQDSFQRSNCINTVTNQGQHYASLPESQMVQQNGPICNPYRGNKRKRTTDNVTSPHTLAQATFQNAGLDAQLFASFAPDSLTQREVQVSVCFNIQKYTEVMHRVEIILADIGDNCAVCWYDAGAYVVHTFSKCPKMRQKCFGCMGHCQKCTYRIHVPKGQCYFCMLPHRSPRGEPYHSDYQQETCNMLGRDRLKPLAWLYYDEFKVDLVEKFGADQVGTREQAAKWMATVNEGGILNMLEIVAMIE